MMLEHLRLDPGLAERREIQPGNAVEHQLVHHDPVSMPRISLSFRNLVAWDAQRQIVAGVNVVEQGFADGMAVMEHGNTQGR